MEVNISWILWNMYNTLFFIDIEKHIILSYMQFISTFFSDKTAHYQIWNKKAVYFLSSFENYGLEKLLLWIIPHSKNIENLWSIKQSNLLDLWLGNGRAINDDEKRTAIDTLFEYLKITLMMNSYLTYAEIWRNHHLQARMPSRYFSGMFMMNR